MDKHYLTWKDFDNLCTSLHHDIRQYEREQNIKFDGIVALLRGGAIPGIWLSHNMNLPMRAIGLKSYEDTQQTDGIELYNNIGNELKDFIENKAIIFVDDICDSGRTYSCIKDLCGLDYKNIFVTLHCAKDAYYTPDIFAAKSNRWIVYPWEP